ncbi:MAG: non-hydrolyzing UDP-N-acetylglucosamine 2-epimerase [Desulfomonilaceae bacterium]
MKKTIVSVVGARPNFMKIAPLDRALKEYPHLDHCVVHTGQHYDANLSDVFFQQLDLPTPHRSLGVGSGGHGEMTGKIMIEFEKVCLDMKPDMVVVVGDVNSTIAAALTARKLFIPVAHVEAGLRSFDETMPEELNRRLTDCLSNLLFVSEPSGMENLRREGIDMARAHLVGDIMLETLELFLPQIAQRKSWTNYGLDPKQYALVTLHRPSNVDDPEALRELLDILKVIPFFKVFPIHPRTLLRLESFELLEQFQELEDLKLVQPLPYLEFLSLMSQARLVLTDSGSVQSEASFFDAPCLVCRENTERPIYVEYGTCELVGRDKEKIRSLCRQIVEGTFRKSAPMVKELGREVANKTVAIIAEYLS